jgi:hypothetical protein
VTLIARDATTPTNARSGTVSAREAELPDTSPPPEIAAFLARLPEAQRTALERMREVIRGAAPDAVEAIAYGVPAFRIAETDAAASR